MAQHKAFGRNPSTKAIAVISLSGLLIYSCESPEQKANNEYIQLYAYSQVEYRASAARGYIAQKRLAEYIHSSINRGFAFPDKEVLVWTYPRIALAAEHSGKPQEAAAMYTKADELMREVYPGQPIDKTGQFKTLRDAIIFMDSNDGVDWINSSNCTNENTKPNKSL